MKRITEVEIAGKLYALNYSAKALMTLCEHFNCTANDVVKQILPRKGQSGVFSAEIFKNVLIIGAELMEYGARYSEIVEGKEREYLTAYELEAVLSRTDYFILYSAILEAISLGSNREIETVEDPKNAGATQEK